MIRDIMAMDESERYALMREQWEAAEHVPTDAGSWWTVTLSPDLRSRREGAERTFLTTVQQRRKLLTVSCADNHAVARAYATGVGPVYVAKVRAQSGDLVEYLGPDGLDRPEWDREQGLYVEHRRHEDVPYVDVLAEPSSWMEHPDAVPASCPECHLWVEPLPVARLLSAIKNPPRGRRLRLERRVHGPPLRASHLRPYVQR